jgi:feruloyl esterase
MRVRALAFAIAVTAGAMLSLEARADACEQLRSLQRADTHILDAARAVSETGTPYCRIEGRIQGNIGFEYWLPDAARWSGRLLGAGVGGSGGRYNLVDLARGVEQGFASITTDSGHKASETLWMMDRKKAQDYAHRAEHLVALAGKEIAAAYYGTPVKYAYFIGCSGGGRKGLVEMQRYPEDYDGIVAGAPGSNLPVSSARHAWAQNFERQHAQTPLTDADWALVASAALAQCDHLDGVTDGVLENPAECRFDPTRLACTQQQRQQCLSEEKLRLIAAIRAPLTDESGKQLDPGLLPGVRTRQGGSTALTKEMIGQLVYGDPGWEPDRFVMARDTPAIGRVLPELIAEQTDLSAFAKHGGKVILYQGWLDPSVRAQQTIGYYTAVESANGGRRHTQMFARLFMVPGMGHCRGGDGPDNFGGASSRRLSNDARHDLLNSVVAWVEHGQAPDFVVASKIVDGRIVRTRPLCPYPQQAHYLGTGSTDEAENFTCR